MQNIFGGYDQAIENTVKIADKCNFEFSFDDPKLPTFKTPTGMNAEQYLRHVTYKGLERRLADGTLIFAPEGEQV